MKGILMFPGRIIRFYYEGFRYMPAWGRNLWLIIILKLLIMFGVLKIFFFPDVLKRNFDNDKQRSEYIIDQLIKQPVRHD